MYEYVLVLLTLLALPRQLCRSLQVINSDVVSRKWPESHGIPRPSRETTPFRLLSLYIDCSILSHHGRKENFQRLRPRLAQ